jgi:hypothetical protein
MFNLNSLSRYLATVPARIWTAIAIIAISILLFIGYGLWSYNKGQASIQVIFDLHLAADQLAFEHATLDAAYKESKERETIAAAIEAKGKADALLIQSRDRTIADLRSGALKLQNRFTCKASRLSSASASAGRTDKASEGGLLEQDAEFLVRLAAEADSVAILYNTCSDILNKRQASINE